MSLIVVAAWVASVLVFSSFFMKTMVPLRLVAIASNLAFIGYGLLGLESGVFAKVYPILVLHSCLLPLNVVRLMQVRKVTRAARDSSDSDLLALLVPFMKRETYPDGTVLFRRGDVADSLYLVAEGAVVLDELGERVGVGGMFGELGMFRESDARIATAICADDCTLYRLDGDRALELYYEYPEFGIFLLRLIAGYVPGAREPEPRRKPRSSRSDLPRRAGIP
jgi:CRP/FNR family transcriptional regulator, cyclic AMP receptor protein